MHLIREIYPGKTKILIVKVIYDEILINQEKITAFFYNCEKREPLYN